MVARLSLFFGADSSSGLQRKEKKKSFGKKKKKNHQNPSNGSKVMILQYIPQNLVKYCSLRLQVVFQTIYLRKSPAFVNTFLIQKKNFRPTDPNFFGHATLTKSLFFLFLGLSLIFVYDCLNHSYIIFFCASSLPLYYCCYFIMYIHRILNKLTPEKFDKLSLELLNVGIDSPVVLKGIILLVSDFVFKYYFSVSLIDKPYIIRVGYRFKILYTQSRIICQCLSTAKYGQFYGRPIYSA